MGSLLNRQTGATWMLRAEQIIGRANECALRLDVGYVSGHHAEIRWSVGHWQIKDLGSRNGTFVNNERLATGGWRALEHRDVVSFGDPNLERWELESNDAPLPLLLPVAGGEPVPIPGGIIGLPAEAPEATIWLDERGGWWLELVEKPASMLHHGSMFQVGGVHYQLSCGPESPTTELLHHGYDVDTARLQIRHSLDEEYVEALAETDETQMSLGDRQHHVVLLTLARQRLEDRAHGVPEGSCGWVYIEDLMERLKVDRSQLNLHVYRVRQQFLAMGFRNATEVVERRLQTKQVRLGFRNLTVTCI
ncbi:MAG TPA: FHA domain-containing protein [Polyangiaceae bacterium]|nr:FHA domain-containing protein [Polyangiaceae bacterium]